MWSVCGQCVVPLHCRTFQHPEQRVTQDSTTSGSTYLVRIASKACKRYFEHKISIVREKAGPRAEYLQKGDAGGYLGKKKHVFLMFQNVQLLYVTAGCILLLLVFLYLRPNLRKLLLLVLPESCQDLCFCVL